MKRNSIRIATILMAIILSSLVSKQSLAAVHYPVIGENLKNEISSVRASDTFVGGEFVEIWENEYVAVGIPTHPEKGILFRVSFMPISGLDDFMEPTLTSYDNKIIVSIQEREGMQTFEDGSKEVFGSCDCAGQLIHIYAWSWMHVDGYEAWSVAVTWGESAGIQNPGLVIDRTHFGTIESEPAKCGHTIVGMKYEKVDSENHNCFRLITISDSDANLDLEVTTDFKTWSPATYTSEEDLDFYEYDSGVTLKKKILTPELVASQITSGSVFFRIK